MFLLNFQHDNMLRAMFSGRMEVLTDAEGWILIDRCGKHFGSILNFLRDGDVPLPGKDKYYAIICNICYEIVFIGFHSHHKI